MDLGNRILELMKSKHIKNLKELARQIDIPYTTLRAIVDGTIADIKINTALKICSAFNITLNELFQEELDVSNLELASYNGLEDINGLDVSEIEEVNNFIKFVKAKKNNK